ncbi:trafficking protein particle complex subunit 10-like [Ctenocephalides felis]|uniref:trafficking protein particle complex subunit 10-like n=1 Tax=Ctenocephalides felis TaxID=7515 RepID=UPI000E6E4EA9|nr:trafficking protein particle complex subunit 10-like [Ctenocephalides felis]
MNATFGKFALNSIIYNIVLYHNALQQLGKHKELDCNTNSVQGDKITNREKIPEDTLSLERRAKVIAGLRRYTTGVSIGVSTLKSLGKLCGLMPGCSPTSTQLHAVVNLSAGMGDCPGTKQQPSPTDKLKEALSSNDAFQRHYLELAELAMGTYKHIGRIRSARLIGLDIARFSSDIGQMNKAIVFLNDALRAFSDEGWRTLVVQTQLELAACYKKMNDLERYIRVSAAISSSQELEILVRHFYFEEMTKSLKQLLAKKSTSLSDQPQSNILSDLSDVFTIKSLKLMLPDTCTVMQDETVETELRLYSRFPKEIYADSVAVSLEFKKGLDNKSCKKRDEKPKSTEEKSSRVNGDAEDEEGCDSKVLRNIITADDLKQENILVARISIASQLDYRQDGVLGSVSASCQNTRTLRRSSSTKNRKSSDTTHRQDFTISLTNNGGDKGHLVVIPGLNIIKLAIKATRVGVFRLGQVSVVVGGGLEFLSQVLKPGLEFEVVTEPAKAVLDKVDYCLLAGFPQRMVLTVNSGSFRIAENSFITMKMSKGLLMKCENSEDEFSREFKIPLEISEPFQSTKVDLLVLAELPPRKDDRSVEHKVSMLCPWSRKETTVPLHFPPPFLSVCRLHTSQARKFVQVSVRGLHDQKVALKRPQLECKVDGLLLRDLNPGADQILTITNGITASFMWELEIEPLQKHQANI